MLCTPSCTEFAQVHYIECNSLNFSLQHRTGCLVFHSRQKSNCVKILVAANVSSVRGWRVGQREEGSQTWGVAVDLLAGLPGEGRGNLSFGGQKSDTVWQNAASCGKMLPQSGYTCLLP